MSIALICPSNMLYMPYVENYIKILNEDNLDYSIINWDRFHIEGENCELKYKNSKIGHQRNYYDYYKYAKFIIKKLNEKKYDKLVIFGLQLSYFLKGYLLKNYKGNYILDIRDYNKIIRFFNINKLIDSSGFTVVSSNAYKQWLPICNKYAINHNTQLTSLEDLYPVDFRCTQNKINISCIGAIRDYDVNSELINSLKNSDNISLYYHGEGIINEDIKQFLLSKKIGNVFFTGRYNRDNEKELYQNSDFINVFRYNDGINNKTALPNRLYNSAIYGKPMIALEGTYLADQIKEYKLGLVLNSFDNIKDEIVDYLREFDKEEYEKGRVSLFQMILNDNRNFIDRFNKFLEIKV
jgi:hypothetical protein